MPKVFVSSGIKDSQVYRTVIDGQQRISTILSFLAGKFSLEKPYNGEYQGLTFSKLPVPIQNEMLQYRIDFNEAIDFSDEELRETYSRLNKYSVALTKQELRRADFPGDFLRLAEELAINEYLDASKVFTVGNRRRLADVEFVSELLAALIAGPQEKRDNLDSFYLSLASWELDKKQEIQRRFIDSLSDLEKIFSSPRSLALTRFKQKADLYSLILAIDDLRLCGGSIEGKSIIALQNDMLMLNELIAPESEIRDCRDYAIKCVSQANSHASRRWRRDFLKSVISGTYRNVFPTGDNEVLIFRLGTTQVGDELCGPQYYQCGQCDGDLNSHADPLVAWSRSETNFQISNLSHLHTDCVDLGAWQVLQPADSERELTFDVPKPTDA